MQAHGSIVDFLPAPGASTPKSPSPCSSKFSIGFGTQKCMALVAINHPSLDTEVKILKEIDRAKVRHLTRVIAYNLAALRRLRQLDPKINLGLHIAGRPPAIRDVKALGAEVLLPHWKKVSPSFIRRAHRASMLVIPWTVDSLRQMRRTILEGVDGIITNYPAKLSRIPWRASGRPEAPERPNANFALRITRMI